MISTRKALATSLPREKIHRRCSLGKVLELAWCRAWLELVPCAKGELARCLACNAAEDHAIKQRVTTQAIVAVDATSCLSSNIEARDHLAALVQHLGLYAALKTTHAVVDDWCND